MICHDLKISFNCFLLTDGDSDSSIELLMKLEKERQDLKEKRKREKEKLKQYETAEEKRARRLYKKEMKERK